MSPNNLLVMVEVESASPYNKKSTNQKCMKQQTYFIEFSN